MVDQGLTKDGIVLPGLGDCGDRLFGTMGEDSIVDGTHDDDNENGPTTRYDGDQDLVLHPSKRKRSASIDLDKKLEQVEAEAAAAGKTGEDGKD